MNKANLILAAALLAHGAGAAWAQSSSIKTAGNWEFYGRANLAVDKLDDGKDYSKTNFSTNSSYLGLRGNKNFGELTGLWQVESEVQFTRTADDNTNDKDKNKLATRDTFAGISGSYGTLRLGKFDTPFKVARGPANLFGDQMGDMRNLTRAGAKLDERPNNIIQYTSPDLSGFRLALAYSPDSKANTEAGKQKSMTSASATYAAGPLQAALAHEVWGKDSADGDRKGTRLAVAYNVTAPLKLVGFYQKVTATVSNANEGSKVMGAGAEYQLVPGVWGLRGQYFSRDADKPNSDSKLTAIGIDRYVGKEMRFFANYAKVSNGTAAKATPWKESRSTDQTGINGLSATGFSVGMRYDF